MLNRDLKTPTNMVGLGKVRRDERRWSDKGIIGIQNSDCPSLEEKFDYEKNISFCCSFQWSSFI
jgi:hypothetical protein